jgi:hypothetical protein
MSEEGYKSPEEINGELQIETARSLSWREMLESLKMRNDSVKQSAINYKEMYGKELNTNEYRIPTVEEISELLKPNDSPLYNAGPFWTSEIDDKGNAKTVEINSGQIKVRSLSTGVQSGRMSADETPMNNPERDYSYSNSCDVVFVREK